MAPKISWSEELGLSRRTVTALVLLPVVIFAAAHALLLTAPELFWKVTRKAYWFGPVTSISVPQTVPKTEAEEHFAKNAYRYQRNFGPNHVGKITAEVVTAVLALQIFQQARRRGRPGLAKLYLVVAIGAAVVAADEARWGESFGLRVFSEDFMRQVKSTNVQAEMTFHNQPGAMNIIKIGMDLLALYCLAGSLLVAWRRRDWLKEWAFYLFIPHPVLATGFACVLAYSLERRAYKWLTGQRVEPLWSALKEPTELIAVITLMLYCWLVLRAVKKWPVTAHAA